MNTLFQSFLKSVADWKTTVPGALLAGFVGLAQHFGWTGVAQGAPDLLAGLGYIVSALLVAINTKPPVV